MVMEVDTCSAGNGFGSLYFILNGRFFTLICCEIILMFVWKSLKINEKEAGDGPFKKEDYSVLNGDHFSALISQREIQELIVKCLFIIVKQSTRSEARERANEYMIEM